MQSCIYDDPILPKDLFYLLGVCLLGRVDEHLYGVCYGWDDSHVYVLFLTFGRVDIANYKLLCEDINDELAESNILLTPIFTIKSITGNFTPLRSWAFKRSILVDPNRHFKK